MRSGIAAKSLLFNEQGKVLLLVRSHTDTHAPGRLDLPGGEVETGEGFAQAASREAFEETGIRIDPNSLVLAYTATAMNRQGSQSITRLLFIGHPSVTPVTLSHEHSSYDWYSLDEAIQKFTHPFYGPAMTYVQEHGLHII